MWVTKVLDSVNMGYGEKEGVCLSEELDQLIL